MKYITLKKAFHNPNTDAEALYAERFSADNAVHLDVQVEGYPAFFVMTNEIYEAIIRVSKADKEILRLTALLPPKAIEQFTQDNLIDEIVMTNEIEGVNSTRREIGQLLENMKRNDKRKRFWGLVNKYLMLNSGEWDDVIEPKDVRKIYDELVSNEVASASKRNIPDGILFRKDSVSVYDAHQREIHRGIMPEENIIESMRASLVMLNNDSLCDILPRISAFHFLFGYIHPFYDGNGRTNRFISSQYLAKTCEPVVGYGLSYTIKERLNEYYKAFEESEHPLSKGDITPFVITFCDIIAESIERIRDILTKKQAQLFDYSDRIAAAFKLMDEPSKSCDEIASVLLQATLFSSDGISMEELRSVFGIARNTLYTKLKELDKILSIKRFRIGREVHLALDIKHLQAHSPSSPTSCS